MALDLKGFASQMIDSGATDDEIKTTLGGIKQQAAKMMDQGMSDQQIESMLGQTTWNNGKTGKSAKMALANAAEQEKEFTKERQAPAVKEATDFSKKALGVAIPTAAAAVSMLPGVGTLAGSALQAGGTAANQLLGNEPYSAYEIGKSALFPVAAQGLVKAVKGGVTAVGKALAPAATRMAGNEAAMENVGAVGNAIDRSYSVPASKGLYEAAEAKPPLPAQMVSDELKQSQATASKSLQARPARKVIGDTAENVFPKVPEPEIPQAGNMTEFLAKKQAAADQYIEALKARPSEITWRNAIDEAQGLRSKAHQAFEAGNNIAGDTLRNAADSLVAKLGRLNPQYEAANKAYLREQGINKVSEILTKPGPAAKLGVFLQKDPMTKAAFSHEEAKMFEGIAKYLDTIGATGSPYSGAGGRIIDFFATPIAAGLRSKPGMYIMKQAFKDGHVTPQGLATVAQFMRAYQAQGGKSGND